jgi:hypothetical protein
MTEYKRIWIKESGEKIIPTPQIIGSSGIFWYNYARDNNLGTYAETEGGVLFPYVIFNLEEEKTISMIRVYNSGVDCIKQFTAYACNSPSGYPYSGLTQNRENTIWMSGTSTHYQWYEEFAVPFKKAQFIKLIMGGHSTNIYTIREVEIYTTDNISQGEILLGNYGYSDDSVLRRLFCKPDEWFTASGESVTAPVGIHFGTLFNKEENVGRIDIGGSGAIRIFGSGIGDSAYFEIASGYFTESSFYIHESVKNLNSIRFMAWYPYAQSQINNIAIYESTTHAKTNILTNVKTNKIVYSNINYFINGAHYSDDTWPLWAKNNIRYQVDADFYKKDFAHINYEICAVFNSNLSLPSGWILLPSGSGIVVPDPPIKPVSSGGGYGSWSNINNVFDKNLLTYATHTTKHSDWPYIVYKVGLEEEAGREIYLVRKYYYDVFSFKYLDVDGSLQQNVGYSGLINFNFSKDDNNETWYEYQSILNNIIRYIKFKFFDYEGISADRRIHELQLYEKRTDIGFGYNINSIIKAAHYSDLNWPQWVKNNIKYGIIGGKIDFDYNITLETTQTTLVANVSGTLKSDILDIFWPATYNYTINWGDSSQYSITGSYSGFSTSHEYSLYGNDIVLSIAASGVSNAPKKSKSYSSTIKRQGAHPCIFKVIKKKYDWAGNYVGVSGYYYLIGAAKINDINSPLSGIYKEFSNLTTLMQIKDYEWSFFSLGDINNINDLSITEDRYGNLLMSVVGNDINNPYYLNSSVSKIIKCISGVWDNNFYYIDKYLPRKIFDEHIACKILNSDDNKILTAWLTASGNDIYYKEFDYNIDYNDISGIPRNTIITEYKLNQNINKFSIVKRGENSPSGQFYLSYYVKELNSIYYSKLIKKYPNELIISNETDCPLIISGLVSVDSACISTSIDNEMYMIIATTDYGDLMYKSVEISGSTAPSFSGINYIYPNMISGNYYFYAKDASIYIDQNGKCFISAYDKINKYLMISFNDSLKSETVWDWNFDDESQHELYSGYELSFVSGIHNYKTCSLNQSFNINTTITYFEQQKSSGINTLNIYPKPEITDFNVYITSSGFVSGVVPINYSGAISSLANIEIKEEYDIPQKISYYPMYYKLNGIVAAKQKYDYNGNLINSGLMHIIAANNDNTKLYHGVCNQNASLYELSNDAIEWSSIDINDCDISHFGNGFIQTKTGEFWLLYQAKDPSSEFLNVTKIMSYNGNEWSLSYQVTTETLYNETQHSGCSLELTPENNVIVQWSIPYRKMCYTKLINPTSYHVSGIQKYPYTTIIANNLDSNITSSVLKRKLDNTYSLFIGLDDGRIKQYDAINYGDFSSISFVTIINDNIDTEWFTVDTNDNNIYLSYINNIANGAKLLISKSSGQLFDYSYTISMDSLYPTRPTVFNNIEYGTWYFFRDGMTQQMLVGKKTMYDMIWNFNIASGDSRIKYLTNTYGYNETYNVDFIGEYTPTLTIYSRSGLAGEIYTIASGQNIVIPEPIDIMEVSGIPLSGYVPLTINFSCEISGGSFPFLYSWNFDGVGSGYNIESGVPTYQYYYSNSGINPYVVITDNFGQIASGQCNEINVYQNINSKSSENADLIIVEYNRVKNLAISRIKSLRTELNNFDIYSGLYVEALYDTYPSEHFIHDSISGYYNNIKNIIEYLEENIK